MPWRVALFKKINGLAGANKARAPSGKQQGFDNTLRGKVFSDTE